MNINPVEVNESEDGNGGRAVAAGVGHPSR